MPTARALCKGWDCMQGGTAECRQGPGFSQPDDVREGPLEVPHGPPASHAVPHLRQVTLQQPLSSLKLPVFGWAGGSLQHSEPFAIQEAAHCFWSSMHDSS